MRRTLVPAGIIMQIQLMILFRIPPLPRLQDLRRDRPALPPLLLRSFCNRLGHLLLLGTMVEDRGAVLRAGVHALPVFRSGIVHLVEEFEERAVCYFLGVEYDLEGLGVCIQ